MDFLTEQVTFKAHLSKGQTNCGKEEQEVGPGKQNVIVRNACPLDSRFFFSGLGTSNDDSRWTLIHLLPGCLEVYIK